MLYLTAQAIALCCQHLLLDWALGLLRSFLYRHGTYLSWRHRAHHRSTTSFSDRIPVQVVISPCRRALCPGNKIASRPCLHFPHFDCKRCDDWESCRYFNAVQSETFPAAYESDVNMVSWYLQSAQAHIGLEACCRWCSDLWVSCWLTATCMQVVAAPTGSGKTGILELAILRMLSRALQGQQLSPHPNGQLRAIYLAPSKALVQVSLTFLSVQLSRAIFHDQHLAATRLSPTCTLSPEHAPGDSCGCRRKSRSGNSVLEAV